MRKRIPLTDANRIPWLQSLRDHLIKWKTDNKNGVLACSALKQKYRHILNLGENITRFILLNVEQSVIEKRLGDGPRSNHFLTDSISLLPSQFSALEIPNKEEALSIFSSGYMCKETFQDSIYLIYVLDSNVELNELTNKIINEIFTIY